MNVPNILTLIRLIFVPIFGYYLYTLQYTTAVILFLVAGLTDVLDGYIARKYNMITSFGKFADPFADKLMQVTALVLLTLQHKIPWAIVAVVVLKESLMAAGGYVILKKKNHIVTSDWYGKMATVVFYLAVVLIILLDLGDPVNNILIGVALLSTLFALFMYILKFRKLQKIDA